MVVMHKCSADALNNLDTAMDSSWQQNDSKKSVEVNEKIYDFD